MSILRFKFEDTRRHWRLEPVELRDFNLLVGVSGAGKTRTLDSLAAVCATGCGHDSGLSDCSWQLDVETPKGRFVWQALTGGVYGASASPGSLEEIRSQLTLPSGPPTFLMEVISNEHGDVIVERKRDGIRLQGTDKPIRMKDQESVISLLQDEDSIAPLYQALGKVHRSRRHVWSIAMDRNDIRRATDGLSTIESLRDSSLPMIVKVHALHERFRGDFDEVAAAYGEIFPSVQRILLLNRTEEQAPFRDRLVIAIEERGVESPVEWEDLSAGMRRTLEHLFELSLAPSGTVILIDEYENSMGVNCLEAVTDCLLEPTRGIQLVITSHHPYVINNVPVEHWRVVTRQGSTVRVVPAAEIPALDTQSRQDAFIRLLNATEYLDGIR
jgi:predicted ATPase